MSDLRLPPVTFGTANLGHLYGRMSEDDALALLEAAWDLGIRAFDTAPHYGVGLAERRLGRFLAGKPRDEVIVSTKVGRLLRPAAVPREQDDEGFDVPGDVARVWDLSADGVRRSLEESLERLGLDRVEMLYVHDPERYDLQRGVQEALPALVRLREEGVVDAVGMGSMSVDALEAAAASGLPDVLMVAGRYTLAEQPVAARVLPLCTEQGIRIVAASVLNSGLLATDEPGAASPYDYAPVPPSLLAHTLAIRDVCRRCGTALPTAALAFPARDPLVVSTVIAAETREQLAETFGRLHETVPDALWAALEAEGLLAAG
jgi:D-threo-aldose 1-dehydrogenase